MSKESVGTAEGAKEKEKEKAGPPSPTLPPTAEDLEEMRNVRWRKKKKKKSREAGSKEGAEDGDERSFLEDQEAGLLKSELSGQESHLESSRYESELSLRDGLGERLNPAVLLRRREMLNRPKSIHPRQLVILSGVCLFLALAMVTSLLQMLDSPLSLERMDACNWSPWESVHPNGTNTSYVEPRRCRCDDEMRRRSERCGTEKAPCADVPCPKSLEEAAKDPYYCFCWDLEPCKDELSSDSNSFAFLRRSLRRHCPSVHYAHTEEPFARCHHWRVPNSTTPAGTVPANQSLNYTLTHRDILTCNHLHDLTDGPFKDNMCELLPSLAENKRDRAYFSKCRDPPISIP